MRPFAAITSLLLVTGLVGPLLFNSNPPPEEEAEAVLGNPRNLMIAYQRWKTQAKRNGADRKLVLPLGYSKGLSAEFTQAQGQAQLDLTDGTLSVEVRGLPNQEAFDVWLVDNGQSSVKPEPGDTMMRIDQLKHEGGSAKLRARLDHDSFSHFKLDFVVVVRAGQTPAEAGLLFGSPGLFQRLYYSQLRGPGESKTPSPDTASWSLLSAPFSALIPSLAHAGAFEDLAALLGDLVAQGEVLFFEETFGGNGRTCGTCHRAERNFIIDPEFIATLPPNDPLFVAEFNPALSDLENPELMREHGLILENLDGFNNPGVMRDTPPTLGLETSLTRDTSVPDMFFPTHMTGRSGDGAPGDGSLKAFAIGAVTQHFPKTLNRTSVEDGGDDFRIPTDPELIALEAFQRSLGRTQDPVLPLPLTDPNAMAGQTVFLDGVAGFGGKCNTCHMNAGANSTFDKQNNNFNTGVENSEATIALREEFGDAMPPDGGFGGDGVPGDSSDGFGNGKFNTPSLVEAADTLPSFHNGSAETLEEAIDFYNSNAFNDTAFNKIQLDETQVSQIAAFLRVINTLENIRSAIQFLTDAKNASTRNIAKRRTKQAREDTSDGIKVLIEQSLHPTAVRYLKNARKLVSKARTASTQPAMNTFIDQAVTALQSARADMVENG